MFMNHASAAKARVFILNSFANEFCKGSLSADDPYIIYEYVCFTFVAIIRLQNKRPA